MIKACHVPELEDAIENDELLEHGQARAILSCCAGLVARGSRALGGIRRGIRGVAVTAGGAAVLGGRIAGTAGSTDVSTRHGELAGSDGRRGAQSDVQLGDPRLDGVGAVDGGHLARGERQREDARGRDGSDQRRSLVLLLHDEARRLMATRAAALATGGDVGLGQDLAVDSVQGALAGAVMGVADEARASALVWGLGRIDAFPD
ncbi:hypothetical protein PG994_013514 [Apiospora phragmitis]|uniref:ADP-ribosylglycohydrolase family protein n=1 Tax=Apiospora phragmitis TaxID=2905665 RepID=A0ABR1T8V7_9PEZI